ncbi:MAG: YicC/YloC family endoribonuclease [Oceanibaculum nanhaiense]|uniref:YicC/YloC family endoribonuclease n=1 Tax=Oceanibaculum nanhaiense TaxID=1909734 RepID=UPI0025A41C85|nr:YicC/YloC family endoribonuclease [Oceanibaculum nanhaiense]MDM7946881.1 YicC/YloC family endoribonuclease [Oceanibaculum nanhaiense]
MTGFARAEGQHDGLGWAWELKSVNGRGLDIRTRAPQGFESLEPLARQKLGEALKRGNVNVSLVVERRAGEAGIRINRAVLDQVLALQAELAGKVDAAPPRLDSLLAVRGVVEAGEEDADEEARAARDADVLAGLEQAVKALVTSRLEEGARLGAMLTGHLDRIEELTTQAKALGSVQPEALKARLRQQVLELLEASPALNEDRLAQEAALLATKADIREELDRLAAHIAAARELMQAGSQIGRRFDFLCQEFNREANTLCSKSGDTELTRIGLELKAVIDQLKEQVQNVE